MMPASWRLLDTGPADGSWNMACDLALMDVARDDAVGTLRLSKWSRPTVSFGRNERTAGLYSADMLGAHGLEAVRRPTGGRALLHHRDITYSITVPVRDAARWQQTYDCVNRVLLAALHTLGVPRAVVATSDEVPSAAGTAAAVRDVGFNGAICFSRITHGEIVVDGRKLVASAVWRERGAYLQHGSILVHDDQDLLTALLGARVAKPEPAAALSQLLPALPTDDAIARALADAVGQHGTFTEWSIPSHIAARIGALAATLAAPAWLWRR